MALSRIIGHDRAIRILLGTLKSSKVPSSILLSGDSGIGKKLAAINYAKAINCLNPQDFDACDSCSSCKKIDANTHPDVKVLLPDEDEIKIDSIREAEETLSLKPYEALRKFLIIDDADAMNQNAANAFLKTLEEPPPDSIIILVSASPDRLLDTIRSRCMQIRFRPLPAAACRQLVAAQSPATAAAQHAGLAAGQPGICLTRDFNEDKKWFLDILSAMVRGETRCAWSDKGDIKQWLDICAVWLRDLAVSGTAGSDSALLFNEKKGSATLKAVLTAYNEIQGLRTQIDRNLNKSITWNYVSGIIQGVTLKIKN